MTISSPNGPLTILWTLERGSARISGIELEGDPARDTLSPGEAPDLVATLVARFSEYFSGGAPIDGLSFDDLDQSGWTPFQAQVYRAIMDIPHGETRTYGWVAARVGNLSATRAVGQALRNNPVPILVPCHRVVSMTSIGGFMGQDDPQRPEVGLKKTLIGLEERYLSPVFAFA